MKCEYCGMEVQDGLNVCPRCGGIMSTYYQEQGDSISHESPHTIKGLRSYMTLNHVNIDKARLAVGFQAFGADILGIYKNKDGDTVVYVRDMNSTEDIVYIGNECDGCEKFFELMLNRVPKSEIDSNRGIASTYDNQFEVNIGVRLGIKKRKFDKLIRVVVF